MEVKYLIAQWTWNKRCLTLLGLGFLLLLSGCYQVCPSYDGMHSKYVAPDSTDASHAWLTEQDSESAGIERRYDEMAHTHGEVWTVPRATSDADAATSLVPGSNSPWTAVVYTQSAFVLADDEPLEGKLTLRIDHDGRVSALPDTSIDRSAAKVKRSTNRVGASDLGMVGEDTPSYRWLKRFSGLGDTSCDAPPSAPEPDTDDLLSVQFMLAQTPSSAGGLVVFGVQVRGNGRDFSHSQIVSASEKTFSAEFGDVAASANRPAVAGLRVFRITVTAQRADRHVVLPSGEGQLIDATFSPQGHTLYVVDLGFVLQDDRGVLPSPRSGALRVGGKPHPAPDK